MTAERELPRPEFSLVEGGPLYRVAVKLGLIRPPLGLLGPGVALALLTWVPLLVLSGIQGLALGGGVRVPFLWAVSAHTRLLVAIPLFFWAETWIDARLRNFVKHLGRSTLVLSAERPAFDAAIRGAARLRDSTLAEAALAGVVMVFVAMGVRVELPADLSSWRMVGSPAGGRLTAAGWWYLAVALPVFQFLLYRWVWRIVVWCGFLWRLSRLDLQLIPIHPDLAGGLAHLGVVQSHFATVGFAASSVLAAVFAEGILFTGGRLEPLKLAVVGIGLINLVVFVGPLLLFTPRLLATKRQGLREYSALATVYTRGFDTKWIRGKAPADEPLLGSADIQSLADLGNSFGIIRSMRVVPFGPALVTSIVAGAVAPMLALPPLVFPLDELVGKVVRLLLGA